MRRHGVSTPRLPLSTTAGRDTRSHAYYVEVLDEMSSLLPMRKGSASCVRLACPGYPAFLVSGRVTSFQGYGMGSYVVFTQTTATLHNAEAFQAPDTPGVQFPNVFAVWTGDSGGDNSVINGVGGPVTSANPGTVEPVDVTSYP
jgi:hypothetical protein